MGLLRKFSNFLNRATTSAPAREERSINLQPDLDILTALNMAEWATYNQGFRDACNRANILGDYLLHYWNHGEVKRAIREYLEGLNRNVIASGTWMYRDIVFNLSRHFMKPDFNSFYDNVVNIYGYSEEDAIAMETYHQATASARVNMRDSLDSGILEILEGFYQKEQYYLENSDYIDELLELVETFA